MCNKNLIKSILLTLLFTAPVCMVHGQRLTYVDKHLALATELSGQFGIPAPVILAVAIVESAAGKAGIAKRLNNHFGIVGKNHLSSTHRSKYKQYNSDEDSYLDFCKLIMQKSFYTALLYNSDCAAWVSAISKTGYSTQPVAWQKRVLTAIASNKL